MFGRTFALTHRLWVPALLALLVATAAARAHRLEADYRVLPDGRIQLESWFDLTGEAPKGASVQIYGPGNQLLEKGQLDDKGIFVVSLSGPGPFRAVVDAGNGHRKELVLAGTRDPSLAPQIDRSTRLAVKDVLAGVGFLLAVAAFVLSVRNARQLRNMTSAQARPQ
jgi:hypothetical protein